MRPQRLRQSLRLSGWLFILAASTLLTGCYTTAGDGALIGGGLGAASGAIIGHQVGHTTTGALIGTGVGMLTGALMGDAVDQAEARGRASASANPPERVVYRDRVVHDDVEVHHYYYDDRPYYYCPPPPPPPHYYHRHRVRVYDCPPPPPGVHVDIYP